jgi:cytochrome P450
MISAQEQISTQDQFNAKEQGMARPMPFPRQGVLRVSPLFAKLRREAPIIPVKTLAGDPAWMVMSYSEAKTAFSDKRFGYFTHHDPQNAPRLSEAALHSAPMGGLDFEAEVVRLRKLLAPGFTPRRLKLLGEWIQELTDGCLDDMQAEHDKDPGKPVNFHDKVGLGLPVLVIGALLGFPPKDAHYVISLSHRMGSVYNGTDAYTAAAELQDYMKRHIEQKRKTGDLGPDVISDLIRAERENPEFFSTFPPEYYASGLVFPGHETTVARMDFGVMYLLSDPRWRDWLMADPENRIDQTVEEVLRITSATNHGLTRYALEDIEISGVTIRREDLVIISESAANRDPSTYDRPEDFDPSRTVTNHLAFGHGSHICLGQSLARLELRTVFLSLFRRFPEVRLAIDPDTLQIDNARIGGGVGHVPLIW